jgi:hypothetical protein
MAGRIFGETGGFVLIKVALWTILLMILIGSLPGAVQAQSAAQAQNLSYVSGTGQDGGPCSQSQPCRTFKAALALTAAGGVIYVLNSADYGPATINQGVTITSKYAAGVLAASGMSGITISAGSNDVITLSGLDIDGAGAGANGIQFTSGAGLNIENCVIRGFANGIAFTPSGSSALTVSGTVIDNNKLGINFQTPAASTGTLNNVELFANGIGLVGVGTSAGPANIAVQSSDVANSSNVGVLSNGYSTIAVTDSTIANNAIGLEAQNAGALLTLSGSTVTGTGSAWLALNGGNVVSSGTNSINEVVVAPTSSTATLASTASNTTTSPTASSGTTSTSSGTASTSTATETGTGETTSTTTSSTATGYLLDSSGGYLLDANGQKIPAS